MNHSEAWWRTFNTKPVADRQIDQLIGLAQGILADGIVTQAESEMLQAWLRVNGATDNPYVARLLDQVERVLEDGVLDEDEGRELHDALMSWTGGGGLDGEESTTASLPLDPSPRTVRITGNIFVFTGTGVFGTRRMMQDATLRAGGTVERNVTRRTNFVVLGTYVTQAWAHESFGRKIEKAMDYRDQKGIGLHIVHEEDWMQALEPSPPPSPRALRPNSKDCPVKVPHQGPASRTLRDLPREARQIAPAAPNQAEDVERPVGAHREEPLALTVAEAPVEAVAATLESLRTQVERFSCGQSKRCVPLGRRIAVVVDDADSHLHRHISGVDQAKHAALYDVASRVEERDLVQVPPSS